MKFKTFLAVILFSTSIFSLTFGQNKQYASEVISRLSSIDFFGRGYVHNGDLKAAMFIADQFKKNGAETVDKSYLRPFDISINSFPKPIILKADGIELTAGEDFFVGGGSPSTEGDFEMIYLDTSNFKKALQKNQKFEGKLVALDISNFKNKETYKLNATGYIFTSPKNIYWRMSDALEVKPYFYFFAKDSLIKNAKNITVDIKNEFYSTYKTSNVIAQIKGEKYPDSAFVFTAHYDHLGMMGNVIFPGANDNASGVAMLLDMAQHYSKTENKPDYTLIFMAFAAEECGILGAKHMAENPVISLSQIKFLMNLDMIGTGSEGIGMVNAKAEPRADKLIHEINKEHKLFNNIQSRNASCNSDHCPFAEKGVPSIFIYTKGKEYMHYHTPKDNGPVPLTKWDELFTLLDIFIKKY